MTIVIQEDDVYHLALMGSSRGDKQTSHERIVRVAAAQIRERGADTPGVAEIMRAAGLTHGGFYKHFPSRDALIAEAAGHAFDASHDRVKAATGEGADALTALIEWYLSDAHRDAPADGCGLVTLGADAARAAPGVRDAYAEQVERFLGLLESALAADAADEAPVLLSTLVGAMLIARALGDTPQSAAFLEAVRTALVPDADGAARRARPTRGG